jgi:hypothetical protein
MCVIPQREINTFLLPEGRFHPEIQPVFGNVMG